MSSILEIKVGSRLLPHLAKIEGLLELLRKKSIDIKGCTYNKESSSYSTLTIIKRTKQESLRVNIII